MEQPANSSCFWLGLCLVVRYSIDFLSSVPLPSLCRYAPVLSSHSLKVGEWGERGWCLCDDTDPNRSHGKGVECEAARRQRGIEFARLWLQDEPRIWFRCYTSICYYVSGHLKVRVCLHSCMAPLHVWVCVQCTNMSVLVISTCYRAIWIFTVDVCPHFLSSFSALGLNPCGKPCSVLLQSHSDPTLCPPSRHPSLLTAWSNQIHGLIIWNIFVKAS